MTVKAINPASMYPTVRMGYSYGTQSSGSVTLHCSGQVAWNEAGETVGGDDIGLQARQALANLKMILQEAGADVTDVVRLRTYVVNHNPSFLEPITQEISAFYDGATPAANTLVGVQALALPQFLIEIEATAEFTPSE